MGVNVFTYIGLITTVYWLVYVFGEWLNGEVKKR